MVVVIMVGISIALMFWLVALYSCIKVAARADRIAEEFLLGEGDKGEDPAAALRTGEEHFIHPRVP